MYLCLQIDTLNVLTASEVNTVSECPATGYIAAPQSLYADIPTLVDVFTIPVADDLQQMWMTGFALPVICYLTAWAFQVLIGWFNARQG